MKTLKKITAVLLSTIMTVSLAACSSTAKTTSNEKVTLTFWHLWKGSEAEALQKVIDDFNSSHPNIKVEALAGTTKDKQLTALSGGNPPDIGYVIDYTMSKWAGIGAVAPLDEYMTKDKVDSKNFPEPVLNLGKFDGKQYGIPYTMDSYMLYYNKDMLKEAGIEPPKTVSELKAAALKLTKKNSKGEYTQLGFISDNPWLDQVIWPFAFGSELYDYKTDTVTPDSQAYIDALKFEIASYQAPYDMKQVLKFKSGFGEYMSPNNPFFQKQLAFDVEGQWFTTFLKQYAPNVNYGIVPIPYPDGKTELDNGGLIQSGMLYISKASKHKEEAFEFINYLISDEAMIKFCASKGSLPTTFTALNNSKFKEQAPELEPFIQVAKGGHAKALPAVPFTKEYMNELLLQTQSAFNQEITPEEAMKNVVSKIQPLADEWKIKKQNSK